MSRIIAGTAGGHRLATVPGDQTRPTTDRVREAFFSSISAWLGTATEAASRQLDGIAFLDLFAGTGAVGLEAASRGASRVVLVDDSARAGDVLRRNVASTGLPAVAVVRDAAKYIHDGPGPEGGFDIVWLDPPYPMSSAAVDELIDAVVSGGWLLPDSLIVVERSSRSEPPRFPAGVDAWTRRYGETVLHHAQIDAENLPGRDAQESSEPGEGS